MTKETLKVFSAKELEDKEWEREEEMAKAVAFWQAQEN